MKRKIACLAFILFFTAGAYSSGSWVDLNINTNIQPLFSVFAVSNTTVWAGGLQGTVIKTTNEGIDWFPHGGGPVGQLDVYVVACIDSQTVLLGVHQQTPALTEIIRTSNSGQSWSVPFIQQSGWIDDIKMINSTMGYAYGDPVGGRWTLLKTTNGGNSWDSTGMYIPETNGNFGWFNAMNIYYSGFNAPIIWFGTNDGLVYRSSDGGFNWVSQVIPMNGAVYSIAFQDGNTGFCGSDNAVCGSTNGGTNWSLLSAPDSGIVNSFVYNSGTFWYSTDKYIYSTTNEGASFILQHSSPGSTPYHHMSFEYSPNANINSTVGGWAITEKNIVSHYTDHNIGIQQIGTEIPKTFKLGQNFPNPFNPETRIKFDIPGGPNGADSGVKLLIYDATGREVAALINQALKPGYYETSWNAADYSSGIYFYRITAGSFVETKKMILVK